MSFLKKVQNTIFLQNLFKKGDKILLAVSGGPDSVCLLDVFSKLQKKYDLTLAVAHVNYSLRGSDSDLDEKLVRGLAEKYGMPFFIRHPFETQDFASLRGRKMPSENELRDIRYEFFERVRKEQKFDFIAVAHNMDDQAETFLLRLIRGAGLAGLRGMKYKNDRIIRPLLDRSRKDILGYLKENKLKFRIDKTNREKTFTRNKVRLGLIPYLEKNFNPNIRRTLFGSTLSLAQDFDYIDGRSDLEYGRRKTLSAARLTKLHPAVRTEVIRKAIEEAKGRKTNIDFLHIEEILKMTRSTKGKNQIVVLPGLKIMRKGDRIAMKRIA